MTIETGAEFSNYSKMPIVQKWLLTPDKNYVTTAFHGNLM